MTEESLKSKQMAIQFAAECLYYKANPESKMDVPSFVYEQVEFAFNRWIEKHEQSPSSAVNPFKKEE